MLTPRALMCELATRIAERILFTLAALVQSHPACHFCDRHNEELAGELVDQNAFGSLFFF
jgi:hypothetical protein